MKPEEDQVIDAHPNHQREETTGYQIHCPCVPFKSLKYWLLDILKSRYYVVRTQTKRKPATPYMVARPENSRTYYNINLVVDRIEETSHRLQSGHHSKDSTSVSSKQEDLFLTK